MILTGLFMLTVYAVEDLRLPVGDYQSASPLCVIWQLGRQPGLTGEFEERGSNKVEIIEWNFNLMFMI